MRRALGAFLLVVSTGFFLAAFQNCAVYKSSDKSAYEGSEGQPVQAISTSSATAAGPTAAGSPTVGAAKASEEARPCADLVSEGAADAAFGQPTELIDVLDAAGKAACMISTYQNVSEGADTAVCSALPENFSLLYASPEDDGRLAVDPAPEGPMSEGSFGFAHELGAGRVEFVFVGALTGAKDAVACRFAFPSRRKLEASLSIAADRGSRLARAIAAQRARAPTRR